MFNSVDDLKKWINDYINNSGKLSLHIAINNSKEIKNCIREYTRFLPDDTKYNQRCYHILNDIIDIPFCEECKIKKVNFNNRNKDWKYLSFCSKKCGSSNKDVIRKYKETNMNTYGVDNFTKTKYYKEYMKSFNNDKYGVDWYFQSEDIKLKSISTCLLKYGVDSYTKTKKFKDSVRSTCMKVYGVDWYAKSKEFNEKFKKTCINRYGVDHPIFNDDIKSKISNTIKNRYGVDWYVMSDEFKLKTNPKESIKKSMITKIIKYGNPTGNIFSLKSYKLPSGKTIMVQGYENFAIDILLESYDENDLAISYFDIKDEIGIINYIVNESDRIYLPDIYIKSEKKIIEVKSRYTYDIDVDKNQMKKEACLEMGMKFEFWIIDRKGKLSEIL